MNVSLSDTVDPISYATIVDMLTAYNQSKTQELEQEINKPIEIIARNDANEIIGGLYGRSIWGTLEVKTIVVKLEDRNAGIGRILMQEAELEAKRRNCRFISLDTFSFQAPEFYEGLGFEKIGTESDFPKGSAKYHYRKQV